MKKVFQITIALTLFVSLSGCVAAVIPAIAIGNMIMKDGTATVILDGDDDAYKSFRRAAIAEGAIMEVNEPDLSRAELPTVRVALTLQKVRPGRYTLVGSSSTWGARTYEITDNIAGKTQAIAEAMANDGYTIVEVERDRGLPSFGMGNSKNEVAGALPAVTEQRVLAADAVTAAMVREVQAMLNDAGYDAGPADGIPGKRTSKALASYQIDNGLDVTNGVTAAAYKALFGTE
jgi:hypothetical protein